MEEWCVNHNIDLRDLLVNGNTPKRGDVVRRFLADAKKLNCFAAISPLWLNGGLYIALTPEDYLGASREGTLTRVISGVPDRILQRWAEGYLTSGKALFIPRKVVNGTFLPLGKMNGRYYLSIG